MHIGQDLSKVEPKQSGLASHQPRVAILGWKTRKKRWMVGITQPPQHPEAREAVAQQKSQKSARKAPEKRQKTLPPGWY